MSLSPVTPPSASPVPADTTTPGAGAAGTHRAVGAHRWALWVVAVAFLLNMAFSAVPTPLYVLYAARDGLSNLTITLVYAVYAVGVVVSLFFAGHVSDWVGRKVVFVPALLVNVASSVIFIFWPSLTGLIIARVVSGVSVGLTTATATAYVAELHRRVKPTASPQGAQAIATVANLGGIAFGPLAAGFLAQYAPSPLRLPYIVFGAAIAVFAALVLFAPETVADAEKRRYRPQRIAVPRAARGTFFAATSVGFAAFAIFGVFTSLVPVFLAGTMHETSRAVAGSVTFAAFASAAVAQIVVRWDARTTFVRCVPLLVAGLALFTAGLWIPNLTVFIIGGVLTGAAAGLAFRAALVTAALSAPPQARAEVLSGYFLGGYVGLSVPVIGLGLATQHWSARNSVLWFEVLALVIIVAGLIPLLRRPRPTPAAAGTPPEAPGAGAVRPGPDSAAPRPSA